MEQKDKTRKEELLKDFEDKWELEQDLQKVARKLPSL